MTRLELYEYIRKNNLFPFIWTAQEREWLAECLEMKETNVFLRSSTREKLEQFLRAQTTSSDRLPIYRTGDDAPSALWENQDKPFLDKLKLIRRLIQDHRCFTYQNNTKRGENIRGTGYPVSLEVNPLSRNWSFHFIDLESRTMVLANLVRIEIEELKQVQKDGGREYQRIASEFKNLEILLEVSCEKNTLERCAAAFAGYDRQVEYPPKDGKVKMTISCYAFDLDMIVREILAMGPYVMVLGPEPVRNRVIEAIVCGIESCT